MNIMPKVKIKRLLNQLNLKADCFDGNITSIIKKLKSNTEPQIKLYLHIDDACVENDNFQWYLLKDVIQFNLGRVMPSHNCLVRECNIDGCVVSLLVKKYNNSNPDYRYTKINKLEIIYI